LVVRREEGGEGGGEEDKGGSKEGFVGLFDDCKER
jgi:hypothetical protein